jgi:uncharacterized membrane protein
MATFKLIPTFLFGAFIIMGGRFHFTNPEIYMPFIPDFLPKDLVNKAVGILEIAIGIAVFFPQTRLYATLGLLLMMLAFLPLHIADVFKEMPAIGSHKAALVRLPLQFVFILWAWFIYRQ